MSSWTSRRAFWVLGWFVVLYMLDILLAWPTGPHVFTAAADRLLTVPDLLLSAAVVGAIVSKREVVSSRRLAAYAVVGLAAGVATFAWSNPMQIRAAYAWTLRLFHGERGPLSAVEIFQKSSPSVFIVEALDESGNAVVQGSGVALATDFLVTNCHVVQNGSSFRIRRGEEKWTARLIQAVADHDLCGIRPDGFQLLPVSVRGSSTLKTGESVYAIGAPEGLELTFSEGVVSSLRETDGVHIIQTSAPTSPGSSGGGLFDAQGNLIGITTFQLREGQSLNFALPGEWVKSAIDSLAEASRKSYTRLNDTQLESTAWFKIGREAAREENYDLAAHSFQESTDLKVGDAFDSWLELGKLLGKASHIWQTSETYKKWLCSIASREAQCSPVFGFPWERTIREAETKASAAFEEAIELRPDCAEAWLELAKVDDSRKEYNQAIAAAKEATRLAPADWMGWAVLGFSCFRAEDYDEAIDATQKGAKVAPADKQTVMLFVMGEAYAKKGDHAQVMHIYQQLKSSNASDADYFFKEYVLTRQDEYPSTQRSKRDRDVIKILRNASTADNVRQAAWDAFHAAADAEDFERRFDAIPLPNEVKAELWDLKFGAKFPK